MPSPLGRDYLERVEERAVQECTDAALGTMQEFIGPDGSVYGDVDLKSPEEFVRFWDDLVQRGVTEFLAVVAPKFYDRWASRYERDAVRVLVGRQ